MIGERVRKRRDALGLTQIELANKMGYVSRSTIGKIEDNTNNIPLPKVEQLARALGTTPAYLMGWEEDPNDKLLDMINRLDDEDRARIEERIEMLLEQDKYQ